MEKGIDFMLSRYPLTETSENGISMGLFMFRGLSVIGRALKFVYMNDYHVNRQSIGTERLSSSKQQIKVLTNKSVCYIFKLQTQTGGLYNGRY